MTEWPRLVQEIKVRPHLGDTPNETITDSWEDVQFLPWILSMKLKRVFLSKDDKYVLGEKQSGHTRFVARFFPPNIRDQNV